MVGLAAASASSSVTGSSGTKPAAVSASKPQSELQLRERERLEAQQLRQEKERRQLENLKKQHEEKPEPVQSPAPPPKKKKMLRVVLLTAIVLALIGGGIFLGLRGCMNGGEPPTTTDAAEDFTVTPLPSENTQDKISGSSVGSFIIHDGYIYFHAFSSTERRSGEFRMQLDGTEVESIDESHYKIVSDLLPGSKGDHHFSFDYYYCMLYLINRDGSERKPPIKSVISAVLADDWLYYNLRPSSNAIRRIRAIGTSETLVYKDLSATQVTIDYVLGDWIYYRTFHPDEHNVLCRIKTDGSNQRQLFVGAGQFVHVSSDWIYYNRKTEPGTFRMRTNGTEDAPITEVFSIDGWENIWKMTESDGWLYFQGSTHKSGEKDAKSHLYRMRPDGTGLTKLTGSDFGPQLLDFIIEGDWIFFRGPSANNGWQLYRMNKNGRNLERLSNVELNDIPEHSSTTTQLS